MKKEKKNQLKIVIFTAVKKFCILNGRVFVMLLVDSKNISIVLKTFFLDFGAGFSKFLGRYMIRVCSVYHSICIF